jgi:hypothetical protein
VLLEVAVATVLLMTAMALAAKLVIGVTVERRAAERRLWAVQEVSNLAERLSGEPYDRLDADRARELAAGAKTGSVLPDAEWAVEVHDAGGNGPAAKRVTVSLRWKDRSGGWTAPVRATSWVYRGGNRS